jgi:hypothetical protein
MYVPAAAGADRPRRIERCAGPQRPTRARRGGGGLVQLGRRPYRAWRGEQHSGGGAAAGHGAPATPLSTEQKARFQGRQCGIV